MKFGIYKEETEEEKPLKIRLIRSEQGAIRIVVVDDEGDPLEGGHIASIVERGTLLVWENVDPKLGFQLDEDGRILIEK